MGRGRAKAKQTKVARQLKYHSGGTDLDRLRAELAGDSSGPASAEPDVDDEVDEDPDDLADYDDPYGDDEGDDYRVDAADEDDDRGGIARSR